MPLTLTPTLPLTKIWDVHTRKCVQTFSDVHSDQVWVKALVRVRVRVRVRLRLRVRATARARATRASARARLEL